MAGEIGSGQHWGLPREESRGSVEPLSNSISTDVEDEVNPCPSNLGVEDPTLLIRSSVASTEEKVTVSPRERTRARGVPITAITHQFECNFSLQAAVASLFELYPRVRDRCKVIPLCVYGKPEVQFLWNYLVDVLKVLVIFGFNIERVDACYILLSNLVDHVDLLYTKDHSLKSWISVPKFRLGLFAAVYKNNTKLPTNPFHRACAPLPINDRRTRDFLTSFRNSHSLKEFMSLVDSVARGVKKGCERPSKEFCADTIPETFKKFTTKKESVISMIRPYAGILQDNPSTLSPVMDRSHWIALPEPMTGHLPHKASPFGLPEDGEKSLYELLVSNLIGSQVVKIDQEKVKSEVLRSIDELIRPDVFQDLKWSHFPSTSACVENRFADGGAVPVVHEELKAAGLLRPIDITLAVADTVLVEPRVRAVVEGNPLLREAPPIVPFSEVDHLIDVPFSQSCLGVSLGFSDSVSQQEIELLAGDYLYRTNREMTLVALAEALKVRGISKGNGLEGWILKPLQAALSRELGRSPYFQLTRTPITSEILSKMFGDCPDNTTFLSGDYKDATNELLVDISRCCIRGIIKRTNLDHHYPMIAELAERSLCDNFVKYSIKKDGKTSSDEGWQKGAQPMGKILSFVCLCLINFAVCRFAMELDGLTRLPVGDPRLKILVNGDDCCFPIRNYITWAKTAQVAGLEDSIGKTFFSSEFIEMNSISAVRTGQTFEVVPYINFGLLKGLQRSALSVDEEKDIVLSMTEQERLSSYQALDFCKFGTIGAIHRELVKSLDDYYRPLTDMFIKYNYRYLHHEIANGISWFLPEWLGGFGLAADPLLSNISEWELRVAAGIYSNYTHLQVGPVSIKPDWLVHAKVREIEDEVITAFKLESMQDDYMIKVTPNFDEIESNRSQLYGRLVQKVFNESTVSQIFSPSTDDVLEKRILNRLRHNAAGRRKFLNQAWSNDPLEYHKLWHQKRQKRNFPIFIKREK